MSTLDWSVVGVGIAGRARCQAIRSVDGSRLVAVWNGRFAAEVGAPIAPSFEAAIECAAAVAIASPTEHHAAQVEAVLRAGRHCLVEFPVARTEADAERLFALADHVGRVLHVEHIELLDAAGRTLANSLHPELVEHVDVRFERPGAADAGPPALALGNVARLHRLCAIAGPVAAITAIDASPGELRAELLLRAGARASLCFLQSPYVQRRTTITVRTPNHVWEQVDGDLRRDGQLLSLLSPRSLFAQDHSHATRSIRDGAPPYVSRERILHVLRIVERLGAGATGALG